MNYPWSSWITYVAYLILNIIIFLFLLRLAVWLVLYLVRKIFGVDVSVNGIWLNSLHFVRIRWKSGEIGFRAIKMNFRWFDARSSRLIRLSVEDVYCIGTEVPPTERNANPKAPHKLVKRLKAIILHGRLQSCFLSILKVIGKLFELSTEQVFIDWPLSFADSARITLMLKDLIIKLHPSPQKSGIALLVTTSKGTLKVFRQKDVTTDDSRDFFVLSLIGQLLIDFSFHGNRPVHLVQLNMVPAAVYMSEDIFSLLKTERLSVASSETQPSIQNTRGPFINLLPKQSEVMVEDGTIIFMAKNKKLAVKISRCLVSSQEQAGLVSMETNILNVQVFSNHTVPTVTVKQIHHKTKMSSQEATNILNLNSLRGSLEDKELYYWYTYVMNVIKDMKVSTSSLSDQQPEKSSKNLIELVVGVPMVTTIEASDWRVDFSISSASPQQSSSLVCRLMLASMSSFLQSHLTPKGSVRLNDLYLHVPGLPPKGHNKPSFIEDDPTVLPSTHRHIWGRVVAIGNCFAEISKEECPDDNERDHPICLQFTTSSVSAECSVELCRSIHTLAVYVKEQYPSLLSPTPAGGPGRDSFYLHLLEKCKITLKSTNVTAFLSDTSGGSKLLAILHTDGVFVENSTKTFTNQLQSCKALTLQLFGAVASCEILEDQGKLFPCLLMQDMPEGLVETSSLTITVDHKEPLAIQVDLSDVNFNWNTSAHCTLKHIATSYAMETKDLLSIYGSRKNEEAIKGDSKSPLPLPLASYLAKYPIFLSLKVKKSLVNIKVSRTSKVTCATSQSILILQNGCLKATSEKVECLFEKKRIIELLDLSLKMLDKDDPVIKRSSLPDLSNVHNTAVLISSSSTTLHFPYNYKFVDCLDKLINIRKFIQLIHSTSKPSETSYMMPDLYLQTDLFSFQIQDYDFEFKLKSNHMLMSDGWPQREDLLKAFESKVVQLANQKGKKLSIKQKHQLYMSVEEEYARLYYSEADGFYGDSCAFHLFEIRFQDLSLALLSDSTMTGRDNLGAQLRDIDGDSPYPPTVEYSTLIGWYMMGQAKVFQLLFRDFPRPLLHQSDVAVSGRTVFAEEEAIQRATREAVVEIDPPWDNVTVVRKMAALKLYHDWIWKCSVSEATWGSCYEPVLAQVNLAFENIIKKSIDPSHPLPFWDKWRVVFHGCLDMRVDEACLMILNTRDPYNTVEYLDLQIDTLRLYYNTGVLEMGGGVNVFMHTASKYDDCHILRIPHAEFRSKFQWVCEGDNPNSHCGVMPCNPEKVPALPEGQVHDSFASFRSKHLNLNLNLELKQTEDAKGPQLVLYASTLRLLQQLVQTVFERVSRPICKGRVFGNVRPKRTTFSRHLKNVDISFACDNGTLCYWGSASQVQGVLSHLQRVSLQLTYYLTLVPYMDGLLRRPRADWSVLSCQATGEDIQGWLCSSLNQVAVAEFDRHDSLDESSRHHLVTLKTISYLRPNVNAPGNISPELQVISEYKQEVKASSIRVSWTFNSRTILFNLFDAYTKAQALKNNLLSEALKSKKPNDVIPSFFSRPSSSPDSRGSTPEGEAVRDLCPPSPGGGLLKQLITDVNRFVEHVEERGRDDPKLKGREAASSMEDISERCWLIQLENIQMALQGVETKGTVIISSSITHVTNHKHHPQMNSDAEVVSKSSWIGRVEDMQYFATVGSDVVDEGTFPWLSSSTISGQAPVPIGQGETSVPEEDAEFDVFTLLGHLGPSSDGISAERQTLGPFLKRSPSSHKDPVGGLVNSIARNLFNEPLQLQRISSRCYCQIFYIDFTSVPSPPLVEGLKETDSCVSTFTIRHPSVSVTTTSTQYAMMLDIVNNVLLYKEPKQKQMIQRMDKLRFSLQLSNINDCRKPILVRQERVRQLLQSIRQAERELYIALKTDDVPQGTVHNLKAIIQEKKQFLNESSQELDILMKFFKDNTFLSTPPSGSIVKRPHPVLRIEVWLDDGYWWIADKDGQLQLADVTLTNCSYTRLLLNDDSGEHRFELGTFHVRDLSPNAMYRDVLSPYDPKSQKLRVDKNISLRVYCRDIAPVAGISVKEHFEVNVVPLAVHLTQQFYNKMFEFFFPASAKSDGDQFMGDKAQLLVGSYSSDMVESGSDLVESGRHTPTQDTKTKRKQENSQHSAPLKEAKRKTTPDVTPELSDVDAMTERASQVKTFIYVKVTKVPLFISYHGRQGGLPIDIADFQVSIPNLEYHSQNWTWKDLFVAIKKDCKQAIIPKAIKKKFGMEESHKDPQLSIQGSEKQLQGSEKDISHLLGFTKSIGNPTRKSLMGKGKHKDSKLEDTI